MMVPFVSRSLLAKSPPRLSLLILPALVLALSLTVPTLALPSPKSQTIFDYRTQLSLTDAQVAALRAQIKALSANMSTQRKKVDAVTAEYRALLSKGNPPLETVHAKLLQVYKEQGELSFIDYSTSRRIRDVLTPVQLKKWTDLQQKMRN